MGKKIWQVIKSIVRTDNKSSLEILFTMLIVCVGCILVVAYISEELGVILFVLAGGHYWGDIIRRTFNLR